MTPHRKCRRWLHALRSSCVECTLRAELERVTESESDRWFRTHYPNGYNRFVRPHLQVVDGGKR